MTLRSTDTAGAPRFPSSRKRGIEVPRRLAFLAVGVVIPIIGLLSYSLASDARGARPSTATLLEANPISNRSQIVLVFIGSTQCAFSRPSTVAALVQAAIDSTRQASSQMSFGFSSTAIVASSAIDAGVEYLDRIAQFDEIVISNGRSGSVMAAQLDSYGGSDATPQLVVLQRGRNSALGTDWKVQRVLHRAVGAAEIEKWIGRGAPVVADNGGLADEP